MAVTKTDIVQSIMDQIEFTKIQSSEVTETLLEVMKRTLPLVPPIAWYEPREQNSFDYHSYFVTYRIFRFCFLRWLLNIF